MTDARGRSLAVSIHAPARGATRLRARPPSRCRSFNSRAREGRDSVRRCACRVREGVSIHAPARGATLGGSFASDAAKVSIHAPARGATTSPLLALYVSAKFQFTRPRGARLVRRLRAEAGDVVSIHAPARGATVSEIAHDHRLIVSIHAPARGATPSGGIPERP